MLTPVKACSTHSWGRPVAVIVLSLLFLASGNMGFGGSASADLVLEGPRQIKYDVSDFTDAQGKHWIHVTASFAAAYPRSVDQVVNTLWDFAGSPKVFSRLESVKVRSNDGRTAVTEQRTAVRILGLAYISDIVLLNELERSNPSSALVKFRLIGTDGSCLATAGAWHVVQRSDTARTVADVEYDLDTIIEPRFPAQAAIMRGFGPGDMRHLLRELGDALAKRYGSP